jgi:superoxide dismutase
MNPHPQKNRLIQTEKTLEQSSTVQNAKEFASVEELLRQDAGGIQPPASIWERLKKNLGEAPSTRRSWWRRWFS